MRRSSSAATNGAASAYSHADRHSDPQSDRDTPAIVTGTIAAHPVRCLSAEEQYRRHQKFRNRLPRERRSQRGNAEIARRLLENKSDSSD
jgi:hypothetical protein